MEQTGNIYINNIRLYAYHGVLPQERRVGGYYRVSVRAEYPLQKAMESDDVGDTVSYADMLDVVRTEMEKPSNLLEHVAGRIARVILNRWSECLSVRVSVTKENPPMGGVLCDGAGVEITMAR